MGNKSKAVRNVSVRPSTSSDWLEWVKSSTHELVGDIHKTFGVRLMWLCNAYPQLTGRQLIEIANMLEETPKSEVYTEFQKLSSKWITKAYYMHMVRCGLWSGLCIDDVQVWSINEDDKEWPLRVEIFGDWYYGGSVETIKHDRLKLTEESECIFDESFLEGYHVPVLHGDGTEGRLNPATQLVVWADNHQDLIDWKVLAKYIANYQNKYLI